MIGRFFKWLGSFFSSKQRDIEFYAPRERLIYSYNDGEKLVKADPLSVYKRLMTKGPELSIDIKVANSPSKDAGKAHEAMLAKIREIFQIKSYAEGGLTELETVELLDHFMEYCHACKKKSKTSVTLQNNTVVSSPTTSVGNGQPTDNTSHSGSSENVPTTAEQTSSPAV